MCEGRVIEADGDTAAGNAVGGTAKSVGGQGQNQTGTKQ